MIKKGCELLRQPCLPGQPQIWKYDPVESNVVLVMTITYLLICGPVQVLYCTYNTLKLCKIKRSLKQNFGKQNAETFFCVHPFWSYSIFNTTFFWHLITSDCEFKTFANTNMVLTLKQRKVKWDFKAQNISYE